MAKCPPVSFLGLRMDNDAIFICVGLRLGVPLCRANLCRQCGATVDEYALHSLSCVKSQGRHPRHNAMNDIIHLSMAAAGLPSQKEPYGLALSDGKRPDSVTMMSWECGRPLIWDATCSDTYAQAYLPLATNRSGAVAGSVESKKQALYSHLQSTHTFVQVAVETTRAFGTGSLQNLKHLGSRLRSQSGNPSAFNSSFSDCQLLCNRATQWPFVDHYNVILSQLILRTTDQFCVFNGVLLGSLFLFIYINIINYIDITFPLL